MFGRDIDKMLEESRKEREQREDQEEQARRAQEDKRVAESLEYCRSVQSQYAELEKLSGFVGAQYNELAFMGAKHFYETLAELIDKRTPSSGAWEELNFHHGTLLDRNRHLAKDATSLISTGKPYLPVDIMSLPSFLASQQYAKQEEARIFAAKALKERTERERERKEKEMAEIRARLKALEKDLGVTA